MPQFTGLPERGLSRSYTTPVMKLWDAHLIRSQNVSMVTPPLLCVHACVCLCGFSVADNVRLGLSTQLNLLIPWSLC